MMNRHQFLLMLSTCILIPGTASSAYNGQYPSQAVFNPDFSTTAKQTLTDSKTTNADNLFLPLPNIRSFSKSAKVCFITDKGNCSGNSFETPPDPFPPTPDSDKCYELGFRKTSCEAGWQPYRYCPYDSKYFKECICKDTCAGGYQEKTCSSGSIVADSIKMSCKTCYKCRSCKDECPGGYSTGKGTCNQESSNRTECGSVCYKIISNTCTTGSLTAPLENDSQKNKIVSYTACSNPCFQSYSDVCDSGYTKNAAVSGKCYDTMTTTFGTVCRKEKPCCDDTCSGYRTQPSSSICPAGSNNNKTGCGNNCYTCKACTPQKWQCESELKLGINSSDYWNTCSNISSGDTDALCTEHYNNTSVNDGCGGSYMTYQPISKCFSSTRNKDELFASMHSAGCSTTLTGDVSYDIRTGHDCIDSNYDQNPISINLNGHKLTCPPQYFYYSDLTVSNGDIYTYYKKPWGGANSESCDGPRYFRYGVYNNLNLHYYSYGGAFGGLGIFNGSTTFNNFKIYCDISAGLPGSIHHGPGPIKISGYFSIDSSCSDTVKIFTSSSSSTIQFSSGAYLCFKGTKYTPKNLTFSYSDVNGSNLATYFNAGGSCS